MIVLPRVTFVAAPSFRSRAYAQRLVSENMLPERVLMLPGDEPVWSGSEVVTVNLEKGCVNFRPGQTVCETFKQLTTVETASSRDVNCDKFIDEVTLQETEVAIYSGFGGVILKRKILDCGVKFLHVHGGYAPTYRGSTAFYYSILREALLGATGIWLDRELDAGPILFRQQYPLIKGIDIDFILDPVVRADVLVQILQDRIANGKFSEGYRDDSNAETYFIIHPVLKNIALQKCGIW